LYVYVYLYIYIHIYISIHLYIYIYIGTNGKLLPLYKEPSRSSERLGSLFPGDDVLAYGVAVNSDKSERGDVDQSGSNHVFLFVTTFYLYIWMMFNLNSTTLYCYSIDVSDYPCIPLYFNILYIHGVIMIFILNTYIVIQ
jgi:hypothetical protein